jgi:hypothetical protein
MYTYELVKLYFLIGSSPNNPNKSQLIYHNIAKMSMSINSVKLVVEHT